MIAWVERRSEARTAAPGRSGAAARLRADFSLAPPFVVADGAGQWSAPAAVSLSGFGVLPQEDEPAVTFVITASEARRAASAASLGAAEPPDEDEATASPGHGDGDGTDDGGDGSDDGKRPPRTKTIVVSAAVSALLAVAGGGAWLLLAPRAEPQVAEAPPPPPEIVQFLKLDPLIVPLRRKDGSMRPVGLVVSLDLAAGETASAGAPHQVPRLRDAFLRALSRPPLVARAEDGRVSLDEVKARLLLASRTVLGNDAVRAVLVQGAD